MTRPHWKTQWPAPRPRAVSWPSAGQIVRQLGLVLLVAAVWGVAFAGFVWATGGPGEIPVAAQAGRPTRTPLAAAALPATATALTTPAAPPATATSPAPIATATSPAPAATAPGGSATPEPAISPTAQAASATPAAAPSETQPAPATATLEATPAPPAETPAETAQAAGVSFARDVLPIFERRCVKCHGGEKTEEGLVLKTHADVMAGSFNGTVIEPGNPATSYLVEQITSGEMPKREPRLLPAEIRAITAWVEAGAPDN